MPTAVPGYRPRIATSASIDALIEHVASGVQLMLPISLYAESVDLSQIAAGRLHTVLHHAL